MDASRVDDVARALDGCEVCVNCVDYRLNLEVMRGALAAGAHYVDLGGLYHMTRRQLDLDARFREAGLTAILGMGSAPGKTNLLARAAAERLAAEPVSMRIWAASRDPAAADQPLPAPYSVRTLLDELRMPPVVLRDGELTEVEPLSNAGEYEFPPPIGRARAIYTLHSELATLPSVFPTLREASFQLSLPEQLVEKLLALPEDEEPEPYVQSPQAVAVHVVDVGSADGRRVVATAVTHGGSARSTAEPPARAALELRERALSARGALPPEVAIPDPEAFLSRLDTEVRYEIDFEIR